MAGTGLQQAEAYGLSGGWGAYLCSICEDLFCLEGKVSYTGLCTIYKIWLASRIRRSASRWRTAEWSAGEPPAGERVDAQFPID